MAQKLRQGAASPAASPAAPRSATARIGASAAQLGFSPPPVALRLRLRRAESWWSLFLQPHAPCSIGPLVEWIEPWTPLRIEFGARRLMRADFDPVPEAWHARFHTVRLDTLDLYPGGDAVATVTGPHPALAELGRALSTAAPIAVSEVRDASREPPLLTRAQDQALRAAIEAGYYRIPRPVNLHELAARLGVSPGSLSERLRRAEGRIILRYAEEGDGMPWDGDASFSS